MEKTELEVRVFFVCAALVAMMAMAFNLASLMSGVGRPWVVMAMPIVGLLLAALEALGIRQVGTNVPVRLLVSVLIGIACLAILET